MEWRWKQLSRV